MIELVAGTGGRSARCSTRQHRRSLDPRLGEDGRREDHQPVGDRLDPGDEAYKAGFEDMPRRVPDLKKAGALMPGIAPRSVS